LIATENSSLKVFNVREQLEAVAQIYWFMTDGVVPMWLDKYTVPFSFILTRWGVCFNFNMVPWQELVNVNETSSDFYFNANISKPDLALLNNTFPWRASNSIRYFKINLRPEYSNYNPFVAQKGFHLILHSNFEFPFSENRNHFFVGTWELFNVDMKPIVYEADESMEDLSPDE
jgi:hypothetical protein